MRAATDARSFEAGLLEGPHDLRLIHVAHRLDFFKAGFLDRFEFFQHGTFKTDGGVHYPFFERALPAGNGCRFCSAERGRKGGDGDGGATLFEEFAA